MGNVAARLRGGLDSQGASLNNPNIPIPGPANPVAPMPNPADRGGLVTKMAGGVPNSPTPPLAPPTGPMVGPEGRLPPDRRIVPTMIDQPPSAITPPVAPTAGGRAAINKPVLNNPNLPAASPGGFASRVMPGISGVISKLVGPSAPAGIGAGEAVQGPGAMKQLPKPNMQKAQRMNPAEVPNRQRRMY